MGRCKENLHEQLRYFSLISIDRGWTPSWHFTLNAVIGKEQSTVVFDLHYRKPNDLCYPGVCTCSGKHKISSVWAILLIYLLRGRKLLLVCSLSVYVCTLHLPSAQRLALGRHWRHLGESREDLDSTAPSSIYFMTYCSQTADGIFSFNSTFPPCFR